MTLPPWVGVAKTFAKVHWKPLAAVAIVALLAFGWCNRPRPSPVPPKEQHSLDSTDITKPIYQAARDTLIRTETAFVARTVRDTAAAHRLAENAAQAQSRADSLELLARHADSSASLWHQVADARTMEATALQHVVDTLASALLNEKSARLAADSRARIDSSRVVALDDLSHRLAADVKKAGECRVLLVLGCPSRKASFVTGALTTVALGAAVHYHKSLGIP